MSSLPKADLYWNPRPLSQGRLVLDSLSHSRQTCTGLGVPISSGRLVLDSWFPIPKESLSHKPRQICIGFLVSLFKVDLYWISCLIIQGRLVLDSLSHCSRQTCIGFLVSLFKADLYWVPSLIIQGSLTLDFLSHYSSQICFRFLVSLFKADLL